MGVGRVSGSIRLRLATNDQRPCCQASPSIASHAWAEAYVEDLGWISFDPSNSQCATGAYVRLAVAFDYAGASPIRGVRKGGGIEEMSVMVNVLQTTNQ